MKRVSSKIAKALKKAGYPQEEFGMIYSAGMLVPYNAYYPDQCNAPYVMDVWLWLWREKKIYLNTNTQRKGIVCVYWDDTIINEIKDMKLTDPEEVISAAIEYLIDNNLVK